MAVDGGVVEAGVDGGEHLLHAPLGVADGPIDGLAPLVGEDAHGAAIVADHCPVERFESEVRQEEHMLGVPGSTPRRRSWYPSRRDPASVFEPHPLQRLDHHIDARRSCLALDFPTIRL